MIRFVMNRVVMYSETTVTAEMEGRRL